jgi:hypothetical protein
MDDCRYSFSLAVEMSQPVRCNLGYECNGLIETVTAQRLCKATDSPCVAPKPSNDSCVSVSSIIRNFVNVVGIDNEFVGFLEH